MAHDGRCRMVQAQHTYQYQYTQDHYRVQYWILVATVFSLQECTHRHQA